MERERRNARPECKRCISEHLQPGWAGRDGEDAGEQEAGCRREADCAGNREVCVRPGRRLTVTALMVGTAADVVLMERVKVPENS